MAALTLTALRRHYPAAERPALAGLDLAVGDGEIVTVVGPSGCGKSTALRLVAGLDRPDGGRIEVGGKDVGALAPQDRDIAMVFQGYALYPHLTVAENIAFPLRMRRVPRADREARVRDTAARLGLAALLGRHPADLSGGERQRVAMGRAIVREPRVFLFDEPLSNLDAALRAELRVELGALLRRLGTTSLYVTHDQIEAMTLGHRVAVLSRGELQQLASPRVVYEDPANLFVARFLGAPAINAVRLEREGDRLRAPGFDLARPPGLPDAPAVWMTVRPEDVRLDGIGPGAIAGAVAVVEPLGAETHVHVDAGGTRFRARAPGFFGASVGAPVRLAFDPARVLWFDAVTEARLRPGPPGEAR